MITLRVGDCLEVLRTLREESVQCVVTSPPYWGLRDYGVEGQIGLERDPNEYIAKLVAVFREVGRVLRRDGSLWVNMGDSYTDGGRGADVGSTLLGSRQNQAESRKAVNRNGARPFGLGAKQLILMPARLAIAMQADGWILRQDNIWHKPNPMPESVRDRTTRAHEYIFHFAKSRRYYYDAKAIAEPVSGGAHHRGFDGVGRKAKVPAGWATGVGAHDEKVGRYTTEHLERPHSRLRLREVKSNESFLSAVRDLVPMRNKRSVWKMLPRAFKGAHFATFPPELPRYCILASTSARACELCGTAWAPVYGPAIEAEARGSGNKERKYRQDHGGPASSKRRQAHAVPWKPTAYEITGYRRRCRCELAQGTARCVVLDPFGGAGTTGLEADRLGRDAILIELSPAYAEISRARFGTNASEVAANG